MIEKQIIHVAVQTALFQLILNNSDFKLDEDTIGVLAGDISEMVQKKIIDYQLITTNLTKDFFFNPEDVLGEQELKCFIQFSISKKLSPEMLLRYCILHFCPIDSMVEQLHEELNKRGDL